LLKLPTCLQLARDTTYLCQTYTLPDGRTIRVAGERFTAPEALFTPHLVDSEADGISSMIFKCIQVAPPLGCLLMMITS